MEYSQPKRILLIDDETPIAETIEAYAKKENMEIIYANNGEKGIEIFEQQNFDIVLLDWMLPGISGLDIIKYMRNKGNTPILMISARNDEADIVLGLEMGADDYITKPFDSEVLLMKIKAILKRNEEQNKESENKEFDLASYHFNPKLRQLIHDGITQTLSPKENDLLKMLAEHLNDLLPREQALKKIWGSDTYFNGRSMDVYIAKLRKYLKDDPKIEIVNIHGNGFRLVVQ